MMRKQHKVVSKQDGANTDLFADYKSSEVPGKSPSQTQYSHTQIHFNNNFDLSNKNGIQERTQSVQYNRASKSKRMLDPIIGVQKSNSNMHGAHDSPGGAVSTKFTQNDASNPGPLSIINEKNFDQLKQKVNG